MGKFHEGELAMQAQAGVEAMAARIGNGIHPNIFDFAAEFLQMQTLAVIASRDAEQQIWASILTGKPGFLHAISEKTLRVEGCPQADDPLAQNFQPGMPLGLLAIDLEYRLRLRLNGTLARQDSEAFYIDAREVYGNCPKYIQARTMTKAESGNLPEQTTVRGTALNAAQQAWIGQADTFFIASAHPNGGADASHRGGNPGFVRVIDERTLIFPDYSGNMMFNTLGNIAINPAAGLLFLDFESGRTLQLTGQATISWDQGRAAAFPGAERLVTFEIRQALERRGGVGLRFGAPEYSHFNPR